MLVNEQQYYKSHTKLPFIGEEGQRLFAAASVLVIGAGGLGCPCLQYLAGAGIGIIGIADFDSVAESNLHRQCLYTVLDIGKPKTIVAAERLTAYNPHIKIVTHNLFIDEGNIIDILKGYDLIVDCTDNFQVRYLINDACVVLEKPLVYGAIYQTEGHITVFNYNGSPTLRCLFPESNESIQSCADIGAYNIITGIIGIMMANEVIKIIIGDESILVGKLNCIDVIAGSTRLINYSSVATSRVKSIDRFKHPIASLEISPELLHQKLSIKEELLLIDVREKQERDLYNIGGEHIPLNELLQTSFSTISPQTTIVVYCQSGERSLSAVNYLIHKGFFKSISLKGGIKHWKSLF